jgi:hypothetical protein
MRDRLKSAKRVLAVQHQMVKLAEWRLGVLQRQGSELQADRDRLHEFVSGGDPLSPLLSSAAFVRGQHLQKALVQCEADQQAQTQHKDTMRRREKLAEKLVDKAKAEAAHAFEKRALQEVIEAAAWVDDASFP